MILSAICRQGLGSALLLLLVGCASQPTVFVRPSFPFVGHHSIGVFVISDGARELEQTYTNVLTFELLSRGYRVQDLTAAVDSLRRVAGGSNEPRDLAIAAGHGRAVHLVAFAEAQWDSADIYTRHEVRNNVHSVDATLYGIRSPRLKGMLEFILPTSHDVVLSTRATDTCQTYLHAVTREAVLQEAPWMIAARSIRRATAHLPEVEVGASSSADFRIRTVVYVDSTYRSHFGSAWLDRIQRRLLFANDLLRRQFNVELDVREVRRWEAEFPGSLEGTLRRLQGLPGRGLREIRLAVTLDARLRDSWRDRHELGLAVPLGWYAAITAQPSYPEMAAWNAHEEALTIVHEVAHLMGAQHVPFSTSIMYPSSGYLSFAFDATNRRIIEHMRTHLTSSADSTVAREYVRIHAQLRTEPPQNGLNILEPVTRAIFGLHDTSPIRGLEGRLIEPTIDRLVPDPAIRSAVRGYIAFRSQRFAEARRHLEDAVKIEPTFAEAHWYLGQSLQLLGESAKAAAHRQRSNELRPPWMVAGH